MPGVSRSRSSAALTRRWSTVLDDYVTATAWSSNGLWLAAATAGGSVAVLLGRTGELLITLPGHANGTLALAWAPKDRYLATAGQDGTARIWNPTTGEQTAVLEGGATWVEHLCWSDAPYLLATAAGRQLHFWSADGCKIRSAEPHASTISALVWHPGQKRFATSCYGAVRLHAPLKVEPTAVFEYQGSLVNLTWSPDGRWIVCGCQDQSVHIWEVATGNDLQMQGFATKIRRMSWQPGGRHLAIASGEMITIWNFAGRGPAGTRPRMLVMADGSCTALSYQQRGTLLATGGDTGSVCLWSPQRSSKPLACIPGNTQVDNLQWHPDDQSFVCGLASGEVAAWGVTGTGLGFGS